LTKLSGIVDLLQPHGLVVLGVVEPSGPDQDSSMVLAGNGGSDMWSVFEGSPEFADKQPDPLDRWSRRVGEMVSAKLGAEVVFPFDGPPYPPFLKWAQETGRAFSSPLSIFIHTDHGLWHAYRFAMRLRLTPSTGTMRPADASPCLSCIAQPCLAACPVEAFSTGAYRVNDCMAYLAENTNSICRKMGCRARRACPVAVENQYRSEHAKFHMDAFVRSKHFSRDDF
jgi:hypothetical protein